MESVQVSIPTAKGRPGGRVWPFVLLAFTLVCLAAVFSLPIIRRHFVRRQLEVAAGSDADTVLSDSCLTLKGTDPSLLLEILRDPHETSDVRSRAAEVLGVFGGRRVFEDLTNLYECENDGKVRWSLAYAICSTSGIADNQQVLNRLINRHQSSQERFLFSCALAKSGQMECLESLKDSLTSMDLCEALNARIGLTLIARKEVVSSELIDWCLSHGGGARTELLRAVAISPMLDFKDKCSLLFRIAENTGDQLYSAEALRLREFLSRCRN